MNIMFTKVDIGSGKLSRHHSATHNVLRHFFHKPSHLNKTTTYEDPRKDWTEEPPQPREVELVRHPELGFGFVAGSEKPVIVRFVTEGGPSEDKLQPGDQILIINGEDVKKAPRDHVIQLVRSCKETVKLTVCQPPLDNSARKSALLSAAKKAKLKSNPSRVRFAEGVVVNGSPLFPPSTFSMGDSTVPCLPNVLKVFLENGQTKSFKYDSNTLVRDVVESLQQKLCITAIEHFSLVVEHVKSLRRNKLTLLDPLEPLARIAARPGSHNLRCLFRVTFVPKDSCDLAQRDLVAFEYLYMQCCNDVVQERYAPELKYDIALRLAALHIHQHAVSNNLPGKVTVKAIEREFGLERFVPVSLMTTMKRKELRKVISHFLKLNHNLSPSGQKSLTSLQAKLYYLNIIGELPSYGAKCFSTNIRDSNLERVILVSPKFGISQIAGIRNSVPVPLANIEEMTRITVMKDDELSRIVRVHFSTAAHKDLLFNMEDRDADEFVLVLQGYYRLLTGHTIPVEQDRDLSWIDDTAPPYHVQHQVMPAKWSYGNNDNSKHYANFTSSPSYQPVQPKSNGHLPSFRQKPVTSDEVVPNKTSGVDNNMNNMTGLSNINGSIKTKDCNGYSHLNSIQHNSTSNQKLGYDLHSMVSLEILECDSHFIDARNEEVMKRVAEMHEVVQNSEKYLTEQQHHHHHHHAERDREESDSESSHISSVDSDAPGQLKHSDSLLLLTQGQKLLTDAVNDVIQNIDLTDEPSESDTDSMNTPTNSPSHRPNSGNTLLKASDSSFGLHSPDNLLPVGLHNNDQNIQELLKRLQEDSTLPYNFAEGTLYLDPDIIDLTMIPPPITPDEQDGIYALPSQISMPPMPFADSSPEIHSQELVANHRNLQRDSRQDVEPHTVLENMMATGLDLNLDLEAFLATVTVPPPSHQAAPSVELTPEEIMSYIIPPPPTSNLDTAKNSSVLLNGNDKKTNTNKLPIKGPNMSESDSKEKRVQNNGKVSDRIIEYSTMNRKGSAFSCCGKYRESPEKGLSSSSDTELQPKRNLADDSITPSKKSVEYPSMPRVKNHVPVRGIEVPPPSLPPRSDNTGQKTWTLPKKPPLPPMPSQDVLKKAQNNVPSVQLSRSGSTANTIGRPGIRNGHVISQSLANREMLFIKSDATMTDLISRLDKVIEQGHKAQAAGGGMCMDELKFEADKDALTEEARQLVTASKLLVKSVTDVAGLDLPENLTNCLHHLRRLADISADAMSHTTSPLQTQNLISKVRDVTTVFRETLISALKGPDVSETLLYKRAENLASVLATLLRSLRVFSP